MMRDLRRPITPMMKCILVVLRLRGESTPSEICSLIGCQEASISAALPFLVSRNIVYAWPVNAGGTRRARGTLYKIAAEAPQLDELANR